MKVSGAASNQAEFQILSAGTHAAVCTMIVGIGPQESEYQGEVSEKEKVKLRFEVPAERIEWVTKEGEKGEGPMVIWATYTASLHENAKLRQHCESWRGKAFTEAELAGFELDNVLGQPCMISVAHREYNGKTYANISGISKLMKGIPLPQPEGALLSFDPYNHTPEELAVLPEWLRLKVQAGLALWAEQKARARSGYQAAATPVPGDDGFTESDIPF